MLKEGEFRLIKNDYLSSLYRYGEWAMFRDGSGLFEARITSVLDDGKLILEDRQKSKKGYYFKEIEFIIW
jgi:BirA family biotin operon repressor/biotin-[acetyl-CoA-carboxylase] ligase